MRARVPASTSSSSTSGQDAASYVVETGDVPSEDTVGLIQGGVATRSVGEWAAVLFGVALASALVSVLAVALLAGSHSSDRLPHAQDSPAEGTAVRAAEADAASRRGAWRSGTAVAGGGTLRDQHPTQSSTTNADAGDTGTLRRAQPAPRRPGRESLANTAKDWLWAPALGTADDGWQNMDDSDGSAGGTGFSNRRFMTWDANYGELNNQLLSVVAGLEAALRLGRVAVLPDTLGGRRIRDVLVLSPELQAAVPVVTTREFRRLKVCHGADDVAVERLGDAGGAHLRVADVATLALGLQRDRARFRLGAVADFDWPRAPQPATDSDVDDAWHALGSREEPLLAFGEMLHPAAFAPFLRTSAVFPHVTLHQRFVAAARAFVDDVIGRDKPFVAAHVRTGEKYRPALPQAPDLAELLRDESVSLYRELGLPVLRVPQLTDYGGAPAQVAPATEPPPDIFAQRGADSDSTTESGSLDAGVSQVEAAVIFIATDFQRPAYVDMLVGDLVEAGFVVVTSADVEGYAASVANSPSPGTAPDRAASSSLTAPERGATLLPQSTDVNASPLTPLVALDEAVLLLADRFVGMPDSSLSVWVRRARERQLQWPGPTHREYWRPGAVRTTYFDADVDCEQQRCLPAADARLLEQREGTEETHAR